MCNFDGGDCCLKDAVETFYCQQCVCNEQPEIDDQCIFQTEVKNGICEDFANTQSCAFDGGNINKLLLC